MLTATDWFRAYIYYKTTCAPAANRALELLLTKALSMQLPGEVESELDFVDTGIARSYESFVIAVQRGEHPAVDLPI